MDDMPRHAIVAAGRQLTRSRMLAVPLLFVQAGDRATRRVLEFFAAQIRNPNTRAAYGRAVQHFSEACVRTGVTLERIEGEGVIDRLCSANSFHTAFLVVERKKRATRFEEG
jgi:hypothetical protein